MEKINSDTTFNYKNSNISYTTNGKGSVVVLLHGFLENKEMWHEIIPVISKKHRVITIDLLGHGKSDNLNYVHTMEEQAAMVKTLLQHLKLRRVTLIGHSLGGYIALAFAELFSENTKGIVLMNSTALPDSLEKKKNREHAIALVKKNKDIFIKMAIPNLFSPESRVLFKTKIDAIKKDALKTTQQGIIASLEGMKIRKDRSAVLQDTSFKKMMIIGKEDPILNFNNLIAQTKDTNTKLAIFDKGHMSHVENLTELKTAFVGFLKN